MEAMKTKNIATISLFLLCLILSLAAFGFKKAGAGMVVVKSRPVTVERKGRIIKVSGFGALLEDADVVATGPGGKALIKMSNGDRVVIAQNSRLEVKAGKQLSGMAFIFRIVSGKIRAQITQTRRSNVRVATPNAVIGVKGTDFVVSYNDESTQVATMEGLVNMASSATDQSVDIPPGKMSEVSPSGEVMALREIAGDILSGVEIAGEKMSSEDISGERIRN